MRKPVILNAKQDAVLKGLCTALSVRRPHRLTASECKEQDPLEAQSISGDMSSGYQGNGSIAVMLPPNGAECHYTDLSADLSSTKRLCFSFWSAYSMDRDGTLTIDWLEWRDYFLLNPLHNMEDVVTYWKHSSVSTSHY